MFSEKKVWGMEIYFVEREKCDFVLELAISEWGKNKRQSMATESCRRLVEEEHWEKNFVCGQDFLRLD